MAVVGWGSVASFVTRQSLRRAAAAAALLWLASCGRDPYVAPTYGRIDEWRTEQHLDRTTGAPVSNSVILTRKVSTGSMLIAPPARMQLICFKEQPAVVFAFNFKIGSTRNAEVAYRFDNNPGHQPRGRIVERYQALILQDPNDVAQFVKELAGSETLYLRIRPITSPRTSAEFLVAGAGPMIEAAYRTCPFNVAIARRNATELMQEKDD
jgi:hypothetical protein